MPRAKTGLSGPSAARRRVDLAPKITIPDRNRLEPLVPDRQPADSICEEEEAQDSCKSGQTPCHCFDPPGGLARFSRFHREHQHCKSGVKPEQDFWKQTQTPDGGLMSLCDARRLWSGDAGLTLSTSNYFLKNAAFFSMRSFLSSGKSSRAWIESEVQAGTQAPQSMQPSGSTYICVVAAKSGSSCFG